jgi:protein TonB
VTASQRWTAPLALALLATGGLLLIMQSLVWRERAEVAAARRRGVLELVRLVREPTLATRERRRPRKVAYEAPAGVPRLETARAPAPRQQVARVPVPAFDGSLSIAGAPSLGEAPVDSGAVPLVRIAPQYPPRAQARGVEGWVHLRFTVTPEGRTDDVEVLDADPKGYFETAAIGAVRRYKFKPRVEGGVAVPSPGEEIVISFELED